MAVYISLGFLFRLEAVSYLLLGIPLTILFQLCVARQALTKLWLRDEKIFRLNRSGWSIALCLMVFPIYKITQVASPDKLRLLHFAYYSAAILGAFGAGYCYSHFTKKTAKEFLLCFGLIIPVRISFYFFPFLFATHKFNPDYLRGIGSLLTYIPVAFVVEEVVFRGMLDTYLHPSKKTNGLWSALFISCMWGLWHLPLSIQGDRSIWLVAVSAMTISLWGFVLSLFWRRTGNLAVPGFAHAFADAVRDSLK